MLLIVNKRYLRQYKLIFWRDVFNTIAPVCLLKLHNIRNFTWKITRFF